MGIRINSEPSMDTIESELFILFCDFKFGCNIWFSLGKIKNCTVMLNFLLTLMPATNKSDGLSDNWTSNNKVKISIGLFSLPPFLVLHFLEPLTFSNLRFLNFLVWLIALDILFFHEFFNWREWRWNILFDEVPSWTQFNLYFEYKEGFKLMHFYKCFFNEFIKFLVELIILPYWHNS